MTSKNNGLEKSLGVHLLAGTGAGFVESIIMHPLDTLKTRFQAERCLEKVSFSRIWTTTSSMIQQESVWSLYKGFGPVCSIITPKVALQFGGLNFFKQNLQDKSIVPTSAVPVIAGIFTGIVQATFLLTPFELIKVRQQTLRHKDGLYRRQFSAMRHLIQEQGISALYKGLSATIARQSWGLIVKFTGYESVKGFLDDYDPKDGGDTSTPVLHHAIAGGVANVFVGVLNSPPDVVKTRMQDHSCTYKNTWDCINQMYQKEGCSSFFRGSTLRVARIAPGGIIQFAVYGYITNLLTPQ